MRDDLMNEGLCRGADDDPWRTNPVDDDSWYSSQISRKHLDCDSEGSNLTIREPADNSLTNDVLLNKYLTEGSIVMLPDDRTRYRVEYRFWYMYMDTMHSGWCLVSELLDTPIPLTEDLISACVLVELRNTRPVAQLVDSADPGGILLSLIGLPPFNILTNSMYLVAWEIQGAEGGVGDLVTSPSDPHYGQYCIPIYVASVTGVDTTCIYLDAPLTSGMSISSDTVSVRVATRPGKCTITIGTSVIPELTLITYKADYNPSYYYITTDGYCYATNEGWPYRLKGE